MPERSLFFSEGAPPLLRASNNAATISVFAAEAAPAAMMADYAVLFAGTFAKHHAMLNAWDGEAMVAPGISVVFAEAGGVLQAALYTEPVEEDGERCLVFKGLVSAGRGLAAPMLAAAVRAEQDRCCALVTGRAMMRVLPDGGVNVPWARPFARLGFVPNRVLTTRINARNVHRHLTAEPEGGVYRKLEMIATSRDLARESERVLADWAVEACNA